MAKPLVLRSDEGGKVPFLRGILTRALQEAGLGFDDAYRVASAVREDLRDTAEITTEELEALVARHLEPFGEAVCHQYRTRRAASPTILVRYPDGHASPFSRGRLRLALCPCGIPAEESQRVVERLHDRLVAESVTEIPSGDLGQAAYELLEEEVGPEAARRFAVWEEFQRGDRPLLVLVGGATGTGKSTLAAELSNRLEVVRAQSTDMLREVMRMMVPQRMLPVLHASSFGAWQALPQREHQESEGDDLAAGYLAQVELVNVASEAVLHRAIQERVSLIMEGVHVHPSLRDRVPSDSDAIVVQVMLATLKPKRLRRQIKGRGQRVPGRRAKRYLEHFDAIWRLQAFLLSEADRAGVPIVAEDEVEKALEEVIGLVMMELSRTFSGNPSRAFG